ncbi:hypothetical protein RB195_005313 [Necator americanus]|uniref:Uncharacterized protein n=1 Tax=Necator americanus TaxID=51031 RepID=A0ABR1BM98_NECAM
MSEHSLTIDSRTIRNSKINCPDNHSMSTATKRWIFIGERKRILLQGLATIGLPAEMSTVPPRSLASSC